MRHKEGLPVSLLEEGLLDGSGILVSKPGTASASYGLPDESVRLFLTVAAAGSLGLPQSRIPLDLKKDLSAHVLPLEMQGLVAWERDNRGRLAYLVLTWKGEEAIKAARTAQTTPKTSWAARRKASLVAAAGESSYLAGSTGSRQPQTKMQFSMH